MLSRVFGLNLPTSALDAEDEALTFTVGVISVDLAWGILENVSRYCGSTASFPLNQMSHWICAACRGRAVVIAATDVVVVIVTCGSGG